MATASLEERVAAIEAELDKLKQQLATTEQSDDVPWWEKIFGSFANCPEYEEAMRLGREYRESLRLHGDDEGDGLCISWIPTTGT